MNTETSLAARFLATQVLVVAISLLVAAAVATMVGPPVFHDHMLMTGRDDPSLELFHAEQAYRDANLITLAVALPTALICALLASLWLSRRLRTPPAGTDPGGHRRSSRRLQRAGTRQRRRTGGHDPGEGFQHHGRSTRAHRGSAPADAFGFGP